MDRRTRGSRQASALNSGLVNTECCSSCRVMEARAHMPAYKAMSASTVTSRNSSPILLGGTKHSAAAAFRNAPLCMFTMPMQAFT